MIRKLALVAAMTAAVALGSLEARLSAANSVAAGAVISQAVHEVTPSAPAPAAPRGQAQNPPGLGDQKQLEGRIERVDPGVQSIVLEGGTKIVLPDSLAMNRGELKPGVVVRAQYEEREGAKMATTITVTPASPRRQIQ